MIRVVSVITVEDGDDDHNKIKRGKGQECTFMLRTLYTEYFFFFFFFFFDWKLFPFSLERHPRFR